MADGCFCSGCKAPRPEAAGPCSICGDTRRTFDVEIVEQATATVSIDTGVKRGRQSWSYFYMIGALLVGLVGAAIGVLDNIPGWARAIGIICISIMAIVAIADSPRLHSLLLRIRSAYEDKVR